MATGTSQLATLGSTGSSTDGDPGTTATDDKSGRKDVPAHTVIDSQGKVLATTGNPSSGGELSGGRPSQAKSSSVMPKTQLDTVDATPGKGLSEGQFLSVTNPSGGGTSDASVKAFGDPGTETADTTNNQQTTRSSGDTPSRRGTDGVDESPRTPQGVPRFGGRMFGGGGGGPFSSLGDDGGGLVWVALAAVAGLFLFTASDENTSGGQTTGT